MESTSVSASTTTSGTVAVSSTAFVTTALQDRHDENDENITNSINRISASSSSSSSSSSNLMLQSPASSAEFDLFVEDLLGQMQSRFDKMGSSILGRIDEMGKRMQVLEQSIGDIMEQAGFQMDHATGKPLLPTTPKATTNNTATPNVVAAAISPPSSEAVEV